MIQVFLLIANSPGIRAAELAKAVGIERSSVSRNVNALGEQHRNGKPGFGLVEQIGDPHDNRSTLIFLTHKGRQLMRRILAIETGAPADDFSPPTAREAKRQGF